jgi:hypothetical protein
MLHPLQIRRDNPLLFWRLIFGASSILSVLGCLILKLCIPNQAAAELTLIVFLILANVLLTICAQPNNAFVSSVMIATLVLKISSALVQGGMARWGESDQLMYFSEGSQLASSISGWTDLFNWHHLWGTELIVSLSACLFKMVGSSFLLGMFVFSMISYWGQYLYYLTFLKVFPLADPRPAALGLFMWPSIVFWTSALGKDALMMFFLALSSYCMTVLLRHNSAVMLALLLFATLGSILIRPHIALLLLISILMAFHFRRLARHKSTIGRRVIRTALLVCFALCAVYVCARFLEISNMVEATSKIEASVQSNEDSGSGFDPGENLIRRIAFAPLLLIRPFPWEINGVAAGLTSAEGIALLLLFICQRKRVLSILTTAKTNSYLVFVLSFVFLNLSLLGIGSSNFGLLARQRVMILPMIVMCLGVFPLGKRLSCSDRNTVPAVLI